MATLKEWRAQKGAGRKTLPTKVRRISTDLTLLADLGRLDNRQAELEVEAEQIRRQATRADADEDAVKRTRKAGQKARPPRLDEIDAELAALRDEAAGLYDKIRESEGELLLQAISGGEWEQWKAEHPPRVVGHHETTRTVDKTTETTKGGPIYDPNDQLATQYGLIPVCNATDLRGDLGRFVVSWEGEEFGEGEWDTWSEGQVASGDLRALAYDVMELQEQAGLRVPKALSSPATPPDSDD